MRNFIAFLLLAVTGWAAKPNVLFIAVDDLAPALRCYGNLIAKTPHIDRLAATGVRFDRAYNQLPLCNPTRASVMTGLRPDTIKVYDLDRHFRDEVPKAITLSQTFMRNGWWAGRVGKIYHYNVPASIGTDGFDDPPSWQKTVNPKGRDKTDEALIFNAEPHRKISAALSWLAADGTDALCGAPAETPFGGAAAGLDVVLYALVIALPASYWVLYSYGADPVEEADIATKRRLHQCSHQHSRG